MKYKTFIIYIAIFNNSFDSNNKVYFSKKAQIAYLKAEKVSTKVSSNYIDFANIFLQKLATKLSEHIRINNYAIKLIKDCQSLYYSIYNLSSVKLEILKTYIKYNLVDNFIKPIKSLIKVSIFFDKKPDKSLKFYVDY